MHRRLLKYERLMWAQGYTRIAGVDEAGRGPLAGPVVAAAVIFPPKLFIKGVDDSKKLTRDQRKELYTLIISKAEYGVGIIDHTVIDAINIHQATIRAMMQALESLNADYVLVDGRLNLPLNCPHECLTKGDSRSHSIAAASILAKETRDRIMEAYHEQYPNYGFNRHKGYGTAAHIEAIKKWGLCPIHRTSFQVKTRVQT